MSDFNSSLPVRTESAGDVVAKIGDGTTPSQQLGVDTNGRITSTLGDPTTPANKLGIDSSGRPSVTVSDPTTPSQKLGVDAGGRITSKISNGTNTLAVNADGSINVVVAGSTGTSVHNYNTAAAVAAAGTSNHDYTVTTGKTLYLEQIIVAASGKAKWEIRTGPVGTLVTIAVMFTAGAGEGHAAITFAIPKAVPDTSTGTVRIIRTNRDNQAQDLYSTIIGYEQ